VRPWERRRTAGVPDPEARAVTASPEALALVAVAAQAASDKLADDIVAFDVSEQLVITDAFLVCSAANDRQVVSIVDEIEEQARLRLGLKPVRREGDRDARWVLLDFVDVVVHVQHIEERVYYSLERIWRDCPVIELPQTVTSGGARPASAAGESR
jgi:ribosome-associated protein